MKTGTLHAGSILAALLISTSAQAQITADQVWQNWKEMSAAAGQQVTAASESRMGDTLVVTGLNIAVTEPDVAVSATVAEVRFRDTGDGRVEVTMSPSYPMSLQFPNADGAPVVLNLDVTQPNLRVIAGGTPNNATYDFQADSMGIATTSVTEDGDAVALKANVTFGGLSGKYLIARRDAGLMDIDSTFNAASADFVFSFTDPEDDDNQVDAQGSMAQLAAMTSGTFGGAASSPDIREALAAGLAFTLSMSYGASAVDMTVLDAGDETEIRAKGTSGSFAMTMDKSRMAYKAGGTGVEMVMTGGQLPFPEVVISYAEAAFDLLVPLSAGATPQDFGLSFKLADLAVSDEIWSMIDPMGNLPRDPATLAIESRGKATLMVDLMDEQGMASSDMPATLEALDVPTLQVKIAGAELTGNGALTFDNATPSPVFGGMPTPTGTINLNLTGGNGLMDKLVAMGLIPEDQAMSARMMMGMFARPGAGPDSLTSTLEFKDGGFFANGMRLQ